jgi:decaprenylphospho-beta-D-erythro-pentofuranosid-2-ulose 2-reductase
VIDALHTPQRILLLGGTSEIGLAIVRRLLPSDRVTDVILAGRDPDALRSAGETFASEQASVEVVTFDAADLAGHEQAVAQAWASGDVDVVIFAFGVLGDQAALVADPAAAAHLTTVNYLGAVSAGLHVAGRMRQQGHGHIVALSSIAAERARPANFIYGASKAGFDAFFDGLGYDLARDGVTVSVLRPGFVRTRMTEGREVPPLASGLDDVSAAAVERLGRTGGAYVSAIHEALGMALRILPRAIVKRLP